jgi:hypothetical protein
MVVRRPARSRLSRFVGLEEGLTADTALAQADFNLEAHRQSALASLDAAIAAAGAIVDEASPCKTAQEDLYQAAYEIVGLAGLYDLAGLDVAARSLCDLIDLCRERQVWDAPGVAVHLAAMRSLRRPEPGASETERRVLAGLAQIVQR